MKELSVFIDESGDFGEYEHHAPFYIVALVFHDQSADISDNITNLNQKIQDYKLPHYTIHTAPLIRREDEYFNMSLIDRKRIFNAIYNFIRTAKINYHTLLVEKKQCIKDMDLVIKLSKQLSSFLKNHLDFFQNYDRVVCYYDYGQRELTTILVSMFNAMLNNVEFVKSTPAKYKLSQAADMFCTLKLVSEKADRNMMSKSELLFFKSAKIFNKSYLRGIQDKLYK